MLITPVLSAGSVTDHIYKAVGLGNISILLFIVIFKCHDKLISKRFFSIVVSPAQYYH